MPGRVVMVIQDGACWVLREDGTREDLTVESVVTWEPGEWVEFGGGEGYKIESYWAQDLPKKRGKRSSAKPSGQTPSGD